MRTRAALATALVTGLLLLAGCGGSGHSISVSRDRPVLRETGKPVSARNLPDLLGRSDLVVIGKVVAVGRVNHNIADGFPRYTAVRVVRVLRGNSRVGATIYVFGEGGWRTDGTPYQVDNNTWTFPPTEAVYFLRSIPDLALDRPAYALGTAQSRFEVGSNGSSLIPLSDDPLNSQLAHGGLAKLESVVTSTKPASPAAPLQANGPTTILGSFRTTTGTWKIAVAPAPGGLCFGFAQDQPSANECILFSALVASGKDALFIPDSASNAVYGAAKPGLTQVSVVTSQRTLTVATRAMPFATDGWTFFGTALKAGEIVKSVGAAVSASASQP